MMKITLESRRKWYQICLIIYDSGVAGLNVAAAEQFMWQLLSSVCVGRFALLFLVSKGMVSCRCHVSTRVLLVTDTIGRTLDSKYDLCRCFT